MLSTFWTTGFLKRKEKNIGISPQNTLKHISVEPRKRPARPHFYPKRLLWSKFTSVSTISPFIDSYSQHGNTVLALSIPLYLSSRVDSSVYFTPCPVLQPLVARAHTLARYVTSINKSIQKILTTTVGSKRECNLKRTAGHVT